MPFEFDDEIDSGSGKFVFDDDPQMQTESDQLRQEFLQGRNQPFPVRAAQNLVSPITSTASLLKDAIGVQQAPIDIAARAIQSPGTILPDLYNTGKQAINALGTDIAGAAHGIGSMVGNAIENPVKTILGAISPISGAALNTIQQVAPPSEQEIERGVEDLRMGKAISSQKEEDISKSPLPKTTRGLVAGAELLPDVVGGEIIGGLAKAGAKAKMHFTGNNIGESIVLNKGGKTVVRDPVQILDSSAKQHINNGLDLPASIKAADRNHIDQAVVEVHRLDPQAFTSPARAQEAAKKLMNQVESEIIFASKSMPPRPTIELASKIRESSKPHALTPQDKIDLESMAQMYEKDYPQMTAEQWVNRERALNEEYNKPRSKPMQAAYEAERKMVSDTVDQILADSGVSNAKQLGQIKRGAYLLDKQLTKVQNKIEKKLGQIPGSSPGSDVFKAATLLAMGSGDIITTALAGSAALAKHYNKVARAAAKDNALLLQKLHKNLSQNLIVEGKSIPPMLNDLPPRSGSSLKMPGGGPPPFPITPSGMTRRMIREEVPVTGEQQIQGIPVPPQDFPSRPVFIPTLRK